jgi:hypothetical protein
MNSTSLPDPSDVTHAQRRLAHSVRRSRADTCDCVRTVARRARDNVERLMTQYVEMPVATLNWTSGVMAVAPIRTARSATNPRGRAIPGLARPP